MAMMAPTILRMREIVLFLNRLGNQPLTNAPTMMVMMAFNIAWMFLRCIDIANIEVILHFNKKFPASRMLASYFFSLVLTGIRTQMKRGIILHSAVRRP